MSQPATEAPVPDAPARRPSSGGSAFKRKLGPFPMWAWLAIGAAIIIGASVILRKKSAASTADTSNTSDQTAADSTLAADIPQFVNQTYTTVTPPAAPAPVPVVGPMGPPGPPGPTGTPGSPGKPAPKPKAYREVAVGGESLASIAKQRNTTVAHLVQVTEANLDPANLAKFKKYVAGGTSKKMPKGLVYWTSNPGSTVTPKPSAA